MVPILMRAADTGRLLKIQTLRLVPPGASKPILPFRAGRGSTARIRSLPVISGARACVCTSASEGHVDEWCDLQINSSQLLQCHPFDAADVLHGHVIDDRTAHVEIVRKLSNLEGFPPTNVRSLAVARSDDEVRSQRLELEPDIAAATSSKWAADALSTRHRPNAWATRTRPASA